MTRGGAAPATGMIALMLWRAGARLWAATVRPSSGFDASGLSSPTAMAFAPTAACASASRASWCHQDGVLLPTPFVSLTVNASGERGLWVWLSIRASPPTISRSLYTATTPTIHNRVSRFTATATAVAGAKPSSSFSMRSARRPTTTAAPCVSVSTARCHGGRRERGGITRRPPTCSARCCG